MSNLEKEKEKPVEKPLSDEEMITKLEKIPDVVFSLPTPEENAFIDEAAKEIVQSNFFGEKNIMAAKVKVRACLRLKVDPYLYYKHIQIMEFGGTKVLTQSAHLMRYLVLRSYPNAILQQGWVGSGDKLQFNMLVQHPGRKPAPFSFSLEEGIAAGYDKKNSNWAKVPKDMVRSRCMRRCAVTEFAEVLGGLIYTPEDFDGHFDGGGDAE